MTRPTQHELKDVSESGETAWCMKCGHTVRVRWFRLKGGRKSPRCSPPNLPDTPTSARQKRWAKQDARNGNPHTVPPGPALQHVRHLMALGLNYREIAEACQPRLPVSTITMLSQRVRIHRDTERIVLACQPPWTHEGIIRRLQALIADGHPRQWIADRIGCSISNIAIIVERRPDRSRTFLAPAIIALYKQHDGCGAEKCGVDPTIARIVRGRCNPDYVSAKYWDHDTIDDPNAHPDWTGECGTMTGFRIHRRDDIPICRPCRDARNAER